MFLTGYVLVLLVAAIPLGRTLLNGRGAEVETEAGRLDHARAVFEAMQRQYASGNFARYGELLQQLGKLLTSP
jgi:hypothetical protein